MKLLIEDFEFKEFCLSKTQTRSSEILKMVETLQDIAQGILPRISIQVLSENRFPA